MAAGSTCSKCGFWTEQILITCPRCRQQLEHKHCHSCGRCPPPTKDKINNKKA